MATFDVKKRMTPTPEFPSYEIITYKTVKDRTDKDVEIPASTEITTFERLESQKVLLQSQVTLIDEKIAAIKASPEIAGSGKIEAKEKK